MPRCGIARCDRCDFAVELCESWHGVEGLYRIPDSQPIPLVGRWAWCNRCFDISQAEMLPMIGEIRAELRASLWNVSAWGEDVWRCTQAVAESEPISRRCHRRILRSMLEWRRHRRSPPRCLNCGTTDIQFASDDMGNTGVGTICHPNCAGMIHFELGAIWTGICEGYDAYDPEGNRDGIYRFCGGRLQHFADAHVFERLTERQLR